MVGQLTFDKSGKLITPNAELSSYSPSVEVRNLTAQVKTDYETGISILTRPYREFGGEGLSPLSVADRDQLAFNSYEEPQSEDPDEKWRWKGIRPITRNKIISIAGHFIAAILYPNIYAQNEQDEEDKDAANLMKDMVLWNIENSNYKISYLFGIISALVNPVSYLEVEFAEVICKVKEKTKNGKITYREAIDEILSGYKLHNVPLDEMLIDNAYEYDIQKQRFLIRKRLVSWDEARKRFGKSDNWEFVRPGIKTVFDVPSQTFFNVQDESNDTLVEWVTYYNRYEDLQIEFVNGVYVGDENVEANIMKHRRAAKDVEGKPVLMPVYPFVKFGYSPIDEKRFFFYKSAVNELGPQQRLIDRMWRMVMDGTFLDVLPPVGVTGNQVITSNIIYPGAITTFTDRETSITPLRTGGNQVSGMNAITIAEADLNNTAKIPQLPGKSGTTAFEVSQSIQQAKIQLGIFGAMISEMVMGLGLLTIDVILQHQTVGDIEEITGGNVRMKYKSFLLPRQQEGGKEVTKRIELVNEDVENTFENSLKILEEEGGMDSDKRIYRVNPNKFRRMKFLVRINPEEILPKNEIFDKAFKLEAYDRMIQNPLVDQEAVTRDFLIEPLVKGEVDKYIKKDIGLPTPEQGRPQGKTPNSGSIVSEITGNSPLAEMIRG